MTNTILSLLTLLVAAGVVSAKSALGPYSISDITVSGLSSGAYMAVQAHVALSSQINGSAIFAGGPYYCAEANLYYAETKCMKTTLGTPDVSTLVATTHSFSDKGTVDDITNLKDDRVYLFSGTADTVVDPTVMHSLQSYYSYFVDPTNIVADFDVKAEHCLPTLDFGEACATLSSPYIGKCNFDGAGVALTALFGDLKAAAVTTPAANLQTFSQTPYIPAGTTKTSSLDDTGYIYVPTACADGKTTCRLHISFHGCEQNLAKIGNKYAADTGFNTWAESNNIIVLYPYAKASTSMPSNPNGCWDWWAYTGKDYGEKSGIQIQFVSSLIEAVTGKK